MTKLGETADEILEMLFKDGVKNVNELQEKVPLTNNAILDLLVECGLIKTENEIVKITDSGSSILTEE